MVNQRAGLIAVVLGLLLLAAASHAAPTPFDEDESTVPGDELNEVFDENEDVQESESDADEEGEDQQEDQEEDQEEEEEEEEQPESEDEQSNDNEDEDESEEDDGESEEEDVEEGDSDARRRHHHHHHRHGQRGFVGRRKCNKHARALKRKINAARAKLARINSSIRHFRHRARHARKHHHHHHHHHRGHHHHHKHHIAKYAVNIHTPGKKWSFKCWRRHAHKAARQMRDPRKARAFAKFHRRLLKNMWAAVRRSRREKNRTRYFRLLGLFKRLNGAWQKRRALLRAALARKLAHKKALRDQRANRRKTLRGVARAYRRTGGELRKRYEHSYLRYLKLIARFFRRKYKVLVVEYLRERRQNVGMRKAMYELRAKLHTALEAKDLFRRLRAKREALKHWIGVAKNLKAKLAALRARLAALGGAHAALKKAHDETTRNLHGANATIQALRKQIADLQAQLNQSKAALAACQDQLNKTVAAAKAAATAADNKYSALLAQYNAALAAHGKLSKELTDKNNDLTRKLNECNHRCIPDVCGECNGNESTCARVQSEETCHAVGDPHYRSYSGYTFNYQVTGEFSLSRHLHDFEVQNLQQPCPNPAVRCNKAFAVRAGSHVIVVYAAWGPGTILVDGQRVRTTLEKRVDVDNQVSYTAHGNMVEVRFLDALVKGYINPWADTQYMDMYITAPGRWSSGRSLTGLCGSWDGNQNTDAVSLNTATRFWVANTARSLFRNPNPRTEADLEMEDQTFLQEQMQQSAAIAQAMKEAGSTTGQPHHNIELAFKDEEQKRTIEEACSKGVHGSDKLDCEYDMLAGESSKDDRHAFQMSQLLDHEKLLLVCQPITAAPSATIAADRLAADEHAEGFTYAFWYNPSFAPEDDKKYSILSRGTTFTVDVEGSAVVARHGTMTCQSPGVIAQNQWTQITVAISHKGSIKTYINGKRTCTDHTDDPPKAEFGDEALNVVDPSGAVPPAQGYLARLFYLPLTIEKRDVGRYSDRKEPTCDADTPPNADPADDAPAHDDSDSS